MVHEDLVDNRFGNLIVLEHAGWNKRGQSLWLCQCDCGNKTVVTGDKLKRGHTKSCGCLKKKGNGGLNLVRHRFGRLTVLRQTGIEGSYKLWLCECDCGKEIYVNTARLRSGNVKSCGCLKRFEALERQKVMVKKVIRDGTSLNICSTVCHSNTGVRGVTFAHGKYEAYLTLKGKARFRGRFDTLAEAVAARKAAEEKWFGPIIEKWRDAENENNR